jgi:ribosomal RNA-processing protein 8
MSLFAVSGWNAPAKVAASDVVNSRKRKRAAVAEEDAKVQAATVNIEKLMRKLQTGSTRLQRKEKKKENVHKLTKEVPNGGDVAKVNNKDLAQRQKSIKSSPANESKKKKRQENLKDTKFIVEKRATADTSRNHGESAVVKHETTAKGLTALQSTMKSSLEGARFRWEPLTRPKEGTDRLLGTLTNFSTSQRARTQQSWSKRIHLSLKM